MSIQINVNSETEKDVIAQKLSKLMHERHVSAEVLGRAINVTPQTINSIKRGAGNPTIGILSSIATFFNIPLADLLTLDKTPSKGVIINIYDLRQIHKDEKQLIEKRYIECQEVNTPGHFFGIMLSNNMLSPFYEKGALFIATKNSDIVDGDLLVVRINDENNFIKRCIIKDSIYYLQDLLPDSTMEPFNASQVKILGRVMYIHQTVG